MNQAIKKPKYDLETYRRFVREATSYVSIIVGRKIRAEEADTMSDTEVMELALKIDTRVDDLKGRRH
jgi:hypothetical protein